MANVPEFPTNQPTPKASTKDSDNANAQRLREVFLAQRKSLESMFQDLVDHGKKTDEETVDLMRDLNSMLVVLEKMEKRKSVSAEALLNFNDHIQQVGGRFGNVANKTEALRQRRQEREDEDKVRKSELAALAATIGRPLDTFIQKNSELISSGSGSMFKIALASFLGPAAPLVKLMDEMVDFESLTGKFYDKLFHSLKEGNKESKKQGGLLQNLNANYAKGKDAFKNTSLQVWESMRKFWSSRFNEEDRTEAGRDAKDRNWKDQFLDSLKLSKKEKEEGKGGGGILSGLLSTLLKPLTWLAEMAGLMSGGALTPKGKRGGRKIGRGIGTMLKKGAYGAGMLGRGALAAGGFYMSGNAIMDNKGKGFTEGGLNSRAGGYAGNMATGALLGASFGGPMGALIGGIGGLALSLYEDYKDEIHSSLKSIGKFFTDNWQSFKDTLTNFGTSISETWTGFKDKMTGGIEVFSTVMSDSWKEIKKGVSNGWGELKTSLLDGIQSIIDGVKNLWDNGKKKVKEKVQQATEYVGEKAAQVKQAGASAVNWVGEKLGFVAAKEESGKAGYAAVSSGKDDPGGASYGKYQLASKTGTLQNFLKQSGYEKEFAGSEAGSKAFNDKWKQLAQDKNFQEAQDDFIKKANFDPAAKKAAALGFDMTNRGVQEAVFSGSVQHGKIGKVLELATKDPRFTQGPQGQIEAFYDARRTYVAGLSNMPENTRKSIFNRYDREKQTALGVANGSPGVMKSEQPVKAIDPAIRVANATPPPQASPSSSSFTSTPGRGMTADNVPFLPDDSGLLIFNMPGLMA